MTVIVCVDDKKGRSFQGKRQSRDLRVYQDILSLFGGKTVVCTPFSAPLFEAGTVTVRERLFDGARAGEVLFSEQEDLLAYEDRISCMVLYHWNRHYPSDVTLDLDPRERAFFLESTEDFTGSSHDKITREVYRR